MKRLLWKREARRVPIDILITKDLPSRGSYLKDWR